MRLQSGMVNDAISFIDNGLLNTAGVGTTYILRGDEIAIVETGTSLCAPAILEGLRASGVKPRDVRHILLTHVHMDHAGGAGVLVEAMPDARVYLHSLTIPHLIDPSRLLPSAQRALGDLFALHGTIVPLAPERLLPAEELRLDLGRGLRVEAVPTPGHSPDHVAYLEQSTAALFTGDSIGIELPAFGYAGPVTPPPALDVVAQQATFERLLRIPIEHLLFSHWGPAREPARQVISRLRERFDAFDRLMRQRIEQDAVREDEIVQELMAETSVPPEGNGVVEGWIRMSVKGMQRFYGKR
jgi:glyoxylase-like metal-dependent hydrolase (beta-lactamase superfamily II)